MQLFSRTQSFSRALVTSIIFLAYLVGGMIVPIAHTHNGENCCHDACCLLSFEGSRVDEKRSSSPAKYRCTDPDCPFEHAGCKTESTHDHSESPIPSQPHENCVACRLLYMASDVVQFVATPICTAKIADIPQAASATATLADIAIPNLRGPPAC